MARPKVAKEKVRSVNFTIRLTLNEYKQLGEAAEICGISPAALIRKKLFTGKFPEARLPKIDMATYIELKKIGVNINQLVKLAYLYRMRQQLPEQLTLLRQQQEKIIMLLASHDSHPENR